MLERRNFANHIETEPGLSHGVVSYATHHWAHTWLGQNIHGPTVDVDDVVRERRGGRVLPFCTVIDCRPYRTDVRYESLYESNSDQD